MKKLFLLILLLLLTVVNNPILKAQNLNWTVYNTSNSGLPGNYVRCLTTDGNGNLWIGAGIWWGDGLPPYRTELLKYDGTNWTVYNTSNSGLPGNHVNCLTVDGSGNIWVGTENYRDLRVNRGLAKFDGTNWTIYNTSTSGLPDSIVRCLTADESGDIWIGTRNGLSKYDDANWTVYDTSNSGLPDNDVLCIAIDKSGNIWVGTGNGLTKYDGANWTVYNTNTSGLPDNYVNCLTVDDSGNIWIGTGGGLVKYDNTNWTVYNKSSSGLPDNFVRCLAIDGNGNKWIGAGNNGLTKYDSTNWIIYDTSSSELTDNFITCLVTDRSGNKWIGTNNGLAVFNEGGIVSVKELENKNRYYPDKFILSQNYPNPFNPTTNIQYSIASRQFVELKIFNILGQEIETLVNAEKPAGNYQVEFSAKGGSAYGGNAANLPSGVYFYRIQAGSFNQVKKMLLIK